jgi:hypothetical protein
VHGDVRACNTVFWAESSHLIDFDFGGEVGGQNPPKFPENYQFALPDGDRKVRQRSAEISWMDDVFAMTQLIFIKHDVAQPKWIFEAEAAASVPSDHLKVETSELEALRKRVKLQDEKEELIALQRDLRAFADRDDVSQEEAVDHLNDLIEFLSKVENLGWTIRPRIAFLHAMKLWGFDVSDNGAGNWNDAQQEASHATGSPEKDVNK